MLSSSGGGTPIGTCSSRHVNNSAKDKLICVYRGFFAHNNKKTKQLGQTCAKLFHFFVQINERCFECPNGCACNSFSSSYLLCGMKSVARIGTTSSIQQNFIEISTLIKR